MPPSAVAGSSQTKPRRGRGRRASSASAGQASATSASWPSSMPRLNEKSASGSACLGRPAAGQCAREAEPVQQPEAEGQQRGTAREQRRGAAVRLRQRRGQRDQAPGDRDLDRRRGDPHAAEARGGERDAVAEREGGDREQQPPPAAQQHEQPEHEQQVVDAAREMLGRRGAGRPRRRRARSRARAPGARACAALRIPRSSRPSANTTRTIASVPLPASPSTRSSLAHQPVRAEEPRAQHQRARLSSSRSGSPGAGQGNCRLEPRAARDDLGRAPQDGELARALLAQLEIGRREAVRRRARRQHERQQRARRVVSRRPQRGDARSHGRLGALGEQRLAQLAAHGREGRAARAACALEPAAGAAHRRTAPVRTSARPGPRSAASANAGPKRAASSALRVRAAARAAAAAHRRGTRAPPSPPRARASAASARSRLSKYSWVNAMRSGSVKRSACAARYSASSASLGSRSRARLGEQQPHPLRETPAHDEVALVHAERDRLLDQRVLAAAVVRPREAQVLRQAPAHHVVRCDGSRARRRPRDQQRVVVERRRPAAASDGERELEREEQAAEQREAQQRTPHGRPSGAYQIGEVQARSCTVGRWSGSQQPSRPAPIVSGRAQSTRAAAQMRWLQRQLGFSSTRA